MSARSHNSTARGVASSDRTGDAVFMANKLDTLSKFNAFAAFFAVACKAPAWRIEAGVLLVAAPVLHTAFGLGAFSRDVVSFDGVSYTRISPTFAAELIASAKDDVAHATREDRRAAKCSLAFAQALAQVAS